MISHPVAHMFMSGVQNYKIQKYKMQKCEIQKLKMQRCKKNIKDKKSEWKYTNYKFACLISYPVVHVFTSGIRFKASLAVWF